MPSGFDDFRHRHRPVGRIVSFDLFHVDNVFLEPVVRVDFVERDARAEHVDEAKIRCA